MTRARWMAHEFAAVSFDTALASTTCQTTQLSPPPAGVAAAQAALPRMTSLPRAAGENSLPRIDAHRRSSSHGSFLDLREVNIAEEPAPAGDCEGPSLDGPTEASPRSTTPRDAPSISLPKQNELTHFAIGALPGALGLCCDAHASVCHPTQTSEAPSSSSSTSRLTWTQTRSQAALRPQAAGCTS